MTPASAAAPPLFRAIVFKRLPSSDDFTRSEPIVLPGEHAADAAWRAVHAAMRADDALIGGEIRPLPPAVSRK